MVPPRRRLHAHLKSQFSELSPKDTSRGGGLEVSRVYDCSPTTLYILAYFKICCLRIWLPISLKLGADWDHSLWNTGRLVHLQQLAPMKNNQAAYTITRVWDNQELAQGWTIRFFYTRPLLQHWERELICLIHSNRESSIMSKQNYIFQKKNSKTKLQRKTLMKWKWAAHLITSSRSWS